jgi:hypothetical protein
MMLGAVADLIGRNRILMEQTLERLRMLEDGLGATHGTPASQSPAKRTAVR